MAELCIALDTEEKKAIEILESLEGIDVIFKVGPSLYFSSEGRILREINKRNFRIFLDFKFHDIPNTVKLAIRSLEGIGIYMTTLHITGGKEMLEEAVKEKKKIKLIGVTLLTSHDEHYLRSIGIEDSIENYVLKLAKIGLEEGLDGIVCSGQEVNILKRKIGKNFIAVVPGIRYEKMEDDQKRVCTPEEAVRNGADIIVMGRSILNSKNMREEVYKLLKKIRSLP